MDEVEDMQNYAVFVAEKIIKSTAQLVEIKFFNAGGDLEIF